MHDIIIILVAILASLACGIIGVFLVLRKMSMMTDAISHAVLPGVAMMFFLTGSKSPTYMLLGASLMGILATLLIEYTTSKIRVQSDASIGLNFTFLFALGIILVTVFSKKVDLDPECVIYGEIGYAPFDLIITKSGLNLGPKAFYVLGAVLLINIFFVRNFFKGLKITTFDASFAKTLGINTSFYYYTLMALTSITSVATFDVAGAILSVSLMVVPAATAYLLSTNIKKIFILTIIISIVSPVLGYFLALSINSSVSASVAFMNGILFFLGFLINFLRTKNKKY